MAITVRVLDLGELRKWVTADDMKAAGEEMLRMQQARIASGVGQRGRPMKKYDKEYAEERAAQGLPTDKRTLRRTGAMLDSRQVVETKPTSVKIGFQNAPQYAYVNQARTPFVKATKEERRAITEFVKERVKARLVENLSRARAAKR